MTVILFSRRRRREEQFHGINRPPCFLEMMWLDWKLKIFPSSSFSQWLFFLSLLHVTSIFRMSCQRKGRRKSLQGRQSSLSHEDLEEEDEDVLPDHVLLNFMSKRESLLHVHVVNLALLPLISSRMSDPFDGDKINSKSSEGRKILHFIPLVCGLTSNLNWITKHIRYAFNHYKTSQEIFITDWRTNDSLFSCIRVSGANKEEIPGNKRLRNKPTEGRKSLITMCVLGDN